MTQVVVREEPIHRWGPLVGYIIVVGVLAFNLKLQADTLRAIQSTAAENSAKAELSACEVLDHRVSSRLSFITIIGTLRAIALAAATDAPDPRPKFLRAAESIIVPRSPSNGLIEERDRVCGEANISPEPLYPRKTKGEG